MTTLDQLNADLFKRITDGYDKEISDLRLARDEARKLAEELRECAVEHESVYKIIPFPWEGK